ncbi:MAG: diguanylate cyclase [Arenimonas sp.]|uniref:diguanylate cyclase n=1 Tax=Arenimonas sp. TaxID=1872635 RepID=UPI0025C1DA96|nr:diguanylate cyclase [Arenimonas sp.]MBW8367914.1 diguanylate cyclase [Arenimonas sp.]
MSRTDESTVRLPAEPGFVDYVLDSSTGLGSNQVHRHATDLEGRIWLASPVGLSCFDGSHTRHWDRRNGLECSGLRAVCVAPDGEVWIGTDLGIERIGPGLASGVRPGPQGWNFGLCQSIVCQSTRRWLGTAGGLIAVEASVDGGRVDVVFEADVGFVHEVVETKSGRVVAASATVGLVESDGRSWWRLASGALDGMAPTRVRAGQANQLLVGTNQGLVVLDTLTGRVSGLLKPTEGDPRVTAVSRAGEAVWVAFGRSLYCFALAMDGYRQAERVQCESPINDVSVDGLGNVWISTNTRGLAKLSCLRRAIQRIDIGSRDGVYSIRRQSDGGLLVGGERSLVELPGGGAGEGRGVIAGPPIQHETIFWDTLRDGQGTWAATEAGLFLAPPGGGFERVCADDPVVGAPNRTLMPLGDAILVGTLRGLASLERGCCRAMNDAQGHPLGYVYALVPDGEGGAWGGTLGRGLWRVRGSGTPESMSTGLLHADGNAYAIAVGTDGRLAVIENNHVILVERDGSQRILRSCPQVAGWTLVWLDASKLAVGTSAGLMVVDAESGQEVQRIESMLAVRDWEFTNNRTLVNDGESALLCGLTGGLVRVDMALLEGFSPPVCKLLDVAWTGGEPVEAAGVYHMAPGRWSLQARAYCAWFVESDKVRYQFKLVGFDHDWSQPDTRGQASYTSLPTGSYRLLCRALAPVTGLGPERELLRLEVGAAASAMIRGAILGWLERASLAGLRSRRRHRAVIEDGRRLELAVAERTQALQRANRELMDVRDSFRRLAEVDELTQLGNRRRFELELKRTMALSRRLAVPMSLLILDIDHFKAINDRYGHPVGDDYLRRVAAVIGATIRMGEDTATRFGGEEFALIYLSTSAHEAAQGAERLREAVEAMNLPNEGAPGGRVTVSIGVAVLAAGDGDAGPELVARADRALYRAKQGGRNRVELDPAPGVHPRQ